jgi:PAS domain S-box-containing protein
MIKTERFTLTPPDKPEWRSIWARAHAALVVLISGIIFVGWLAHSPSMIYLPPGRPPMHPAAALALLILAVSLWAGARRRPGYRQKLCIVGTAVVILLSGAQLCGGLVGGRNEIARLMFGRLLQRAGSALGPDRAGMAASTCCACVLTAAAIFALQVRSRQTRLVVYGLTLSSALICVAAITRNMFADVAALGRVVPFTSMAQSTAVTFLILAGGLLVEISAPRFTGSPGEDVAGSPPGSPRRGQQNKITVGFGLAALVMCVLGVVSYSSINQFIFDAGWDRHTDQVLGAIDELSAHLSGAEAAARGYVITQNPLFLDSEQAAISTIGGTLTTLKALTSDNSGQQDRLKRLGPLITRKLSFLRQIEQIDRRQGSGQARARELELGVRLMSDIGAVLAEMKVEESRLLVKRLAETESNGQRGIVLITFGAALATALLVVAGWLLKGDVSRRGQAEDALRASEDKFRALVEGGTKYSIITLDTEGCVSTWNSGAQRIKGYRADEVVGRHFSRFYRPEDALQGKPQKELKLALENGEYEQDDWRVRQDGSSFWANVLLTALRDRQGRHLGFSKITRDLTDTVNAEEQARSFFTLSLELLCIAGVDGYFKLLNPAWENTLGFTQAELCAAPFWDFVHPDDLPATEAAAKRITALQPLNHFENRYRCKDGSYRWLLWKVALSADLRLMYCAATDITGRRSTEDEIAGLNKVLRLQNLELETANKDLEAFSYSVSHDLRAPLRSIDGFSQAILEDCGDKLDDASQGHLRRVRASTQRMGQLIDDMLKLSRVGRGEIRHEATDLSRIAREVFEECRSSAEGRDVAVTIAQGLVADADPQLMRIVLTNLLNNAWKFTGKVPRATIEFGCNREGGQAEYFIRDNGAGFDMAYAGKLFGAFQRLHSDKEFPGTGIGLATIQRIIHRHGGAVRAVSKPGEGATFYFSLEGHDEVTTPPVEPVESFLESPERA